MVNPQVRLPDELLELIRSKYQFFEIPLMIKTAVIEYMEVHHKELEEQNFKNMRSIRLAIMSKEMKRTTKEGYTVDRYIISLLRKISTVNYSTQKIWTEHQKFIKETENMLIDDEKRHLHPFTKPHIKNLRVSLIALRSKHPMLYTLWKKDPNYIFLMDTLTEKGIHPDQMNILPEHPQPFGNIEYKDEENTDEHTA